MLLSGASLLIYKHKIKKKSSYGGLQHIPNSTEGKPNVKRETYIQTSKTKTFLEHESTAKSV